MSTRRDFLKGMGLATAGLAVAPGSMLAAKKKKVQPAPEPKNEKVRIAYIGIGNRGQQNIDEFAKTNMVDVVALCDVDLKGKQCEKALKMYPNAKRYTDFATKCNFTLTLWLSVCPTTRTSSSAWLP